MGAGPRESRLCSLCIRYVKVLSLGTGLSVGSCSLPPGSLGLWEADREEVAQGQAGVPRPYIPLQGGREDPSHSLEMHCPGQGT